MITTLDKILIGKTVFVADIDDSPKKKNRMMSLGIFQGSAITPMFTTPWSEPTAYETGGTLIALRKKEAKLIKVICE